MDLGDDATGHAHNPTARHWKAVPKVIGYLKGTEDLGVVFRRVRELKLSLFADAEYSERCKYRRWISSVAVMLGNTAVSTSSMTQHRMTLFRSEAKHVAMVHVAIVLKQLSRC